MLRYAIILVWCCILQARATEDSPRIIIIGSGPAAIAAGSRLLENGFDNITILEAEDRIGGRIYTKEFHGYPLDLGAQWVHGEKGNAAFMLAWPLGLLEHSSNDEKSSIFSSTGEKMDEATANALLTYFRGLVDKPVPDEYKNKTAGDYFEHKLGEYFHEHPEIKAEQYEPLKYTLNLMEMALDSADNWYNVSMDQTYVTCEGDQIINWKDRTYGTIIDIMLKKFPNPAEELPFRNKTVLNAEVSRINYNNPDGAVHVVTENGDEYTADHVIVTPSLGVLKADHEKLFNPALPERKVTAINALQFGSVAKIFLFYPEPWYPHSNELFDFNFYWTDKDRLAIANDPNKSWMYGIYGVINVEHKPNLLCLWLTGPHAREMEKLPEETVMNGAKEILHQFLGKTFNLTEPTAMLRSQWHSNKHFRGTYSYRSPETHEAGVTGADLAEPIMQDEIPRVMFAGEATSVDQHSTVHGAMSSGWREADRLMTHYGRQENPTEASPAA